MRERKSGSKLALLLCCVGRQVQQKARQFFRCGSRKPQIADFRKSGLIDLAQNLGDPYCRFPALSQKLEESLARNKVGLERLQRLGRKLVGLSRNATRQAHHFSSFRYANKNRFAIRRTGREFHAAVANNKDAARILPFDKKDSL